LQFSKEHAAQPANAHAAPLLRQSVVFDLLLIDCRIAADWRQSDAAGLSAGDGSHVVQQRSNAVEIVDRIV
jgi:hypothetical protein